MLNLLRPHIESNINDIASPELLLAPTGSVLIVTGSGFWIDPWLPVLLPFDHGYHHCFCIVLNVTTGGDPSLDHHQESDKSSLCISKYICTHISPKKKLHNIPNLYPLSICSKKFTNLTMSKPRWSPWRLRGQNPQILSAKSAPRPGASKCSTPRWRPPVCGFGAARGTVRGTARGLTQGSCDGNLVVLLAVVKSLSIDGWRLILVRDTETQL